jgi:hypothetical protein
MLLQGYTHVTYARFKPQWENTSWCINQQFFISGRFVPYYPVLVLPKTVKWLARANDPYPPVQGDTNHTRSQTLMYHICAINSPKLVSRCSVRSESVHSSMPAAMSHCFHDISSIALPIKPYGTNNVWGIA